MSRTVRLVYCFRLAPICLLSEFDIKNIEGLHTIKRIINIPEKMLYKSLDDVSEYYLLQLHLS